MRPAQNRHLPKRTKAQCSIAEAVVRWTLKIETCSETVDLHHVLRRMA